MLTQFFKFASVGLVGTFVHYATLLFFVGSFNLNPVLGSTLGFAVGATVNYALNYRFTFKSSKQHHEAIMKFFTVAGVGLILNALIMQVLTQHWKIQYLLAQVIATGIILVWNFLGNRFWTFTEAK